MRTSCAPNFPRPFALLPGRLPELLDEDTDPLLLDVVIYHGFGHPVSPPDLPARFAFAVLQEYSAEGLYAAAPRWYDPTPGRWVQDDPVGFATGDANLYQFVTSDQRGILINEDGTLRDA